jgi:phosphomannomutase/phosphoglucomutase
MKKNKAEGASAAGGGTSVLKQTLPWGAGILVLLVVGLVLIAQLLLVSAPKNTQQSTATSLAEHQAALVSFTLKQYQDWVQELEVNNQVNTALTNPVQARALSQQLSTLRAPAKVYLLSDQDNAMASTLSFLDRDSLGKVTVNKPVVLLTAGRDSMLLMVYRSKNGAGSILVEQPLSPLWQQLHQLLPVGGSIQVSQDSLTLLQAGQITTSDITGKAQATLDIRIAMQLPLHASIMQQPLFWVIAAAMVLLIGFLLWLLAERLDNLLTKDVERLNKQLARLGSGNNAGSDAPQLDVLQAFATRLPSFARQSAPTKAAKVTKKAPASGGITDIVVEEDMSMLVGKDKKPAASAGATLPAEIFRAYDIRGEVGKTLTADHVELLGRAIGSEAMDVGQQTVLVSRDGRLSGPDLSEALIKGLRASGRDVIDLGAVPTPVLYYATKVLDTQTGVCLTGSHNPEQYNGLKIVMNGEALYGDRIQALGQRVAQGRFSQGGGQLETRDVTERYLGDILQDIVLAKKMKVVIDCGNGIAGKLAPQLFRDLGCNVVELFCEVDGRFPNHHPDPGKEENLADLIRTVQAEKADIGLAFDGDGDRIGMVTGKGEIIWPDRLMMLFARDLLSRSPGVDIIFDVKCSRALPALIRRLGGRPLMWKTGHSLIKAKLKETGAPLAGEMSGHLFFADRWFGVDDGLYAGARLLEILSLAQEDSDGVFAQLTTGLATPELSIKTTEDGKFRIIKQLCAVADQFSGGSPTTLDGLRMDYPDGWGLVRASNTTPLLIARFEGKDEETLERIKQQFHKQLMAIDSKLELPF